MKPIPIGTRGSYAKTVGAADLASHLDPSLAAVLSTPTMAAMMEQAAIEAIKPFLDAGESSVGMTIEVSHTAATPPGHHARAEAEVTKADGRRLEFAVRAFDDVEQIGSGSHRRAVIDAGKFNDRLKAKQKNQRAQDIHDE
jgi:fluoroacetyl-CoA thioesterase